MKKQLLTVHGVALTVYFILAYKKFMNEWMNEWKPLWLQVQLKDSDKVFTS